MLNEKLEFSDVLGNVESYHDGQVDSMKSLIETALSKVVKRALETGKVSSLAVTLKFERYDDKRISITGDIKTKLPEGMKESRTFYYDKQGDLSLEDVNQPQMFDREGNVSPLKKVS